MSDLIYKQDAINLLKKWADGYSYIENETESAIKAFEQLPTVETNTVNARVLIPYEELMEPSLCEAHIKSNIGHNLALELMKHIDIRSYDSDLYHSMTKEFKASVVIVTGTNKDGDTE